MLGLLCFHPETWTSCTEHGRGPNFIRHAGRINPALTKKVSPHENQLVLQRHFFACAQGLPIHWGHFSAWVKFTALASRSFSRIAAKITQVTFL